MTGWGRCSYSVIPVTLTILCETSGNCSAVYYRPIDLGQTGTIKWHQTFLLGRAALCVSQKSCPLCMISSSVPVMIPKSTRRQVDLGFLGNFQMLKRSWNAKAVKTGDMGLDNIVEDGDGGDQRCLIRALVAKPLAKSLIQPEIDVPHSSFSHHCCL